MTTCQAHLAAGPLVCTRLDEHQPHHGCVFVSTSGVIAHAPKEGI